MIRRCALFFLLWILHWSAHAAEPRILFLDVWDRSMPMLEAACTDTGFTAAFHRSAEFVGLNDAEAAGFSLVMPLNIDAASSLAVTAKLQAAARLNPAQKVIPLDTRGSHADLEKAGMLVKDEDLIHYWRPNGPVNLRRMLVWCRVKHLGGEGKIEPPVLIPESGYYDFAREDSFETIGPYRDFKRAHNRWHDGAPVAAMIIQQSFWITRDLKVVDAQIAALEKHGLNVVVVFGDREVNVADLITAAEPGVLIEDRHGGMWQSDGILRKLDVPYLRPISMLGYTVDEWRKDPRGLSFRDVGMFMSLQEAWGTLEPVVVGGLHANIQGFRLHEPIPDRVDAFAARAARWASLRAKPNADKKIAIIYYNKGLGLDDLMRGSPTGAFLNGPESLMRFLPEMKKAGYSVKDLPANAADLIGLLKKRGRNLGPWAQGDLEKLADTADPALIPLSTYQHWFETKLSEENRRRVIERFGPPPGRMMTVMRNGEAQLVIPQIRLGNVILAPQPERGETQDEKLLHSRDIPPPHNYLAFYWWLEELYHADAVVHWGTHGSLELLPGKDAGMSADCWSDICASHLPVIDLWITDNLGEATLARRRSYAALVDHMVPPAMDAGLGDTLKSLHGDIHKFNTLEDGLLKEEFRKNISNETRKEHLQDQAGAVDPAAPFPDEAIHRLDAHLHHLYEARTPLRLHVLGEPTHPDEMAPYLVSILGDPFLQRFAAASPSTEDHPQKSRAAAAEFLAKSLDGGDVPPELAKDLAFAREMKTKLLAAGDEITGLLHMLAGGYLPAGPGPDPIRNPASVPTGRNLYSLNPEEIPNRAAWEVARKLVDDLLRTRHPKKIAMDLNGMETMRDFGVMEGQILCLLGVRPVWNRNNLVIDVELIPAEELKRLRVDVFIAMGGQYKENFPSRVTLLDKAVRLAAAAKEAENPVRDHVAAMELALRKKGFSTTNAARFATARIFGTKPGNQGGTNILHLIPRSGVWDHESEIASVYMDNMSFVYSGDVWGEKIDGLYEEALQGTDTILRVWASNMTSQLSNHHAYEYLGGLNMAVKTVTGKTPEALIADVRNPSGASIRGFEEVLAANLRAELLNKKWIEGMKAHDYAGAGHMTELVKNTFGWSVTRPEAVNQDTWREIYQIYVKDSYHLGMNEWFDKVSPHAMQEIAATMLEAHRKGLWQASKEEVAELSKVYGESMVRHGESGGLVGGGNTRLLDQVASVLEGIGSVELAAGMKKAAASSAQASPGGDKVVGKKLEAKPPTPPADKTSPVSKPAAAKPPMATPPPQSWFRWQYAACGILLLLLIAGFIKRAGSP